MIFNVKYGDKLKIEIRIPSITDLRKINPYRDTPKKLKHGVTLRLKKEIPDKPGVYFLFHKKALLYIGNGKSIRQRINAHTLERSIKEIAQQKRMNPEHIKSVAWIEIGNKIDREVIETAYLNLHGTVWNFDKLHIKLKDYPDFPWDKDLEKKEVVEHIKEYGRFYIGLRKPIRLHNYYLKILGIPFYEKDETNL